MSLRAHHNSTHLPVETASFLVIRFGNSYMALPADGVRGVLTQEEAAREQAVTSAGTTYQPVDLAERLSVVAHLSGVEFRTVLYSTGHSHAAIGVEQVVGLTDVERKDCLPLPAQFQGDERNWFQGMMLYENELVLILNPLWVLGELADHASLFGGQGDKMVIATPAVTGRSC